LKRKTGFQQTPSILSGRFDPYLSSRPRSFLEDIDRLGSRFSHRSPHRRHHGQFLTRADLYGKKIKTIQKGGDSMSQVIEAIFENGVFRPLQPVEMTEREVVAIKVISSGEWQSNFSKVIERIHKNTARYRSEEIEADILSAVKEVRKEKYGN
jgi:predicted DNA-binding antitoxin AbrB/MazE fold protein